MRIRVHLGDMREGCWLQVIPSKNVFFSVAKEKPAHRPARPILIPAQCHEHIMLERGTRWLDVRSRGVFALTLNFEWKERGLPCVRVYHIGPVTQSGTVMIRDPEMYAS